VGEVVELLELETSCVLISPPPSSELARIGRPAVPTLKGSSGNWGRRFRGS